MSPISALQRHRQNYEPEIPSILQDLSCLELAPHDSLPSALLEPAVASLFPNTSTQPLLKVIKSGQQEISILRVGVVLSGGQAPGGHNVIAGLFDALQALNSENQLLGFLNGPDGIIKNQSIPITSALVAQYRNQGGFDMIGSGRTKIETSDQFKSVLQTAKELDLDGLVVIGGDDSNTNAAFLAEYFKKEGIKTCVVGVPKTIDGDLKNDFIEISFGFDTACKIYSEIIGNILIDMLSAKKYYFFIKLMGRSASHITLECALKTHPNLAFISEEVAEKGYTLSDLVEQIVTLICRRAEAGKHYGAILIPEGLIEFIPEFKQMISEINQLIFVGKKTSEEIANLLTASSRHCFDSLPKTVQEQLILDRDPHGNIQVSKIETERLFIALVEQRLQELKKVGKYSSQFSPQPLFCGYEGRSALPSNFDAQYCYALGRTAALLLSNKKTGYICCLQNLKSSVKEWVPLAIPLVNLLNFEDRGGEKRAVIRKALVDLKGIIFKTFMDQREDWAYKDEYLSPGPIQFEGPEEIVESKPLELFAKL